MLIASRKYMQRPIMHSKNKFSIIFIIFGFVYQTQPQHSNESIKRLPTTPRFLFLNEFLLFNFSTAAFSPFELSITVLFWVQVGKVGCIITGKGWDCTAQNVWMKNHIRFMTFINKNYEWNKISNSVPPKQMCIK